jgi:thiosulfate/3-mercaptopyruvate sulfurtransferase
VVEIDVSQAAHDDGHIPGAVLWNVYRDLKDASYQLLGPAEFERLVTRSGIAPGSTVVFYGYAPAIGFWLMKRYGHSDVRILDSARGAWHDDGRVWTAAAAPAPATSYRLPAPDERIRADRAAVVAAIGDPARTIVDVRTGTEFRGERFWPSGAPEPTGRAGHVPSAINVPIDGLLDEHGAYRSAEDLRRVFAPLDLAGGGEIITYCTIGARACTAWFALAHLLGRAHVRVYDGSWADWGHAQSTPVAGGANAPDLGDRLSADHL